MAVDVDLTAGGGPHEKRAACLPTKQRNALSKLFERPDFTPEEVHALGHARLLKVSGLGPRGLDIIAGWLAAHDLQLDRAGAVRLLLLHAHRDGAGRGCRVSQYIRLAGQPCRARTDAVVGWWCSDDWVIRPDRKDRFT